MDIMEIVNNTEFVNFAWQIGTTLIFSLADIVSGFISAVIQNNLDSKKMREGLLRKMLIIIIIFLSYIVAKALNIEIVSKIVCIYIIVMESVSILENCKKAGLDLGKLGDLLKINKNEEEK